MFEETRRVKRQIRLIVFGWIIVPILITLFFAYIIGQVLCSQASRETESLFPIQQKREHLLEVRAGNEKAYRNKWITREQFEEYQKLVNIQLSELEER